jgi:hypothetical protein
MDFINFTRPIDEQLQNLLDYGAPHIGSPEVIERFTKQDGLVVLRRPVSSDTLMRVIYSNWSSIASERGLGFLEFVLRMLWTDQWIIKRMWHPISTITSYPTYIIDEERPDHFLTSRIRITIDESVDLAEIIELAPITRRLVPANIVVMVLCMCLKKKQRKPLLGFANRDVNDEEFEQVLAGQQVEGVTAYKPGSYYKISADPSSIDYNDQLEH